MADNSTEAKAFYASRPWLQSYADNVSREFSPLPDTNLAQLIRRASREHAERIAFTLCLDNGMHASLSYRQADSLSDAFCAYLRHDLGLQPGARVAVQMPNCLSYPVAVFGILKAGLVLVNINPLYTAPEMNTQLRDSGASVLILIDLFADKLQQGLDGTAVETVLLAGVAEFFPALRKLLIGAVLKVKGQLPAVPSVAVPCTRLSAAITQGERLAAGDPAAAEPVASAGTDLALLQYTGGTTGVAKGSMLSHGNLLANVSQILDVAGPVIRPDHEVVLTALPLYHIFAFTFNMLVFYVKGSRNILCPSPRPPSKLCKAFGQFPVTKFSGVNVLFSALTREPWFRARVPAIDMSISGGTALHASVAKDWQNLVGSPLCEGFGLSETSPVVAVNQPGGEIRLGSIGLPVPGTLVRIVDEMGEPVAQGEAGELVVSGPQVFQGYWNRADETALCLREGWFHTGDIAVMEADGFLRIVDRKKDMIDVNGLKVYPNEVEDALQSHPDLQEVAVIGLPPSGSGGETIRAYVVCANPALSEQDIIAYARTVLSAYKVPRQVVFRTELPKTPVGKILRKDLRQEAQEEQQQSA